jgi:hypothetical protein
VKYVFTQLDQMLEEEHVLDQDQFALAHKSTHQMDTHVSNVQNTLLPLTTTVNAQHSTALEIQSSI